MTTEPHHRAAPRLSSRGGQRFLLAPLRERPLDAFRAPPPADFRDALERDPPDDLRDPLAELLRDPPLLERDEPAERDPPRPLEAARPPRDDPRPPPARDELPVSPLSSMPRPIPAPSSTSSSMRSSVSFFRRAMLYCLLQ